MLFGYDDDSEVLGKSLSSLIPSLNEKVNQSNPLVNCCQCYYIDVLCKYTCTHVVLCCFFRIIIEISLLTVGSGY